MTKKKMNTTDAVNEFLGENRDIRMVIIRGGVLKSQKYLNNNVYII